MRRVATSMAAMLEGMVDKVVQVVTNDGRNIVGLLKGFDQTTNVILDECHERVFSSAAGVEQVCTPPPIAHSTPRSASRARCIVGRWCLVSTSCEATTCARASEEPSRCPDCERGRTPSPGDALLRRAFALAILRSALVGEVDEELDAELALDEIVAEPLKPVVH